MKRILSCLICFTMILFSRFLMGSELEKVSPSKLQMDETCFSQIDLWIKERIQANNIPGAVIAIGRGDKIAFLEKWGERQRNPVPEPLTWDTIYDLASAGKVVGLAPCIWILVDQGKIAPDDPVCKYVPEFTGGGREKITIIDFLTHTSGIPNGNWGKGSPQQVWQSICQTPCKTKPGEKFEYCCLGFLMLGKVIERVSGETYDHYTRNHLYLPLGMVDTMFFPDPERKKRTATTQFFDGQWLKGIVNDTRTRHFGGGTGNGGNFSTISDLAVFASVMLHKGQYKTEQGKTAQLFSSATFDRMASSYSTSAGIRALGWDKRSDKANRGALMSPQAIGHGGWTGTAIWIDPAFDTFVIMLSNRTNINPAAPNIYPIFANIADRAIDSIRDPHNETAIRSAVRSAVLAAEMKKDFSFLKGRNAAMICDSEAFDSESVPAMIQILKSGISLKTVFCRDDRLPAKIEAACRRDNLPVPDLKKLSEIPNRRLLPFAVKDFDTLVFDAVSSGQGNDLTVADLGRTLQTAADNKKSLFVLDRPNSKGMSEVSGHFAAPGSETKIIFRRLPSSYAMTLGELALLMNKEYRLGMSSDPARSGALGIVAYQKTKIDVPGSKSKPVITSTLSFRGDESWFKYQRSLYLIYSR
ncbi:MAG: serine hydrolase [Planctomycetia bacterium]|nr:serine hydrolase [Planctomycetia bacterium]